MMAVEAAGMHSAARAIDLVIGGPDLEVQHAPLDARGGNHARGFDVRFFKNSRIAGPCSRVGVFLRANQSGQVRSH